MQPNIIIKSVKLAFFAMALVLSEYAYGQEHPLDSYYARLSLRDHYNSQGTKLVSVAAIIRQDRANVHKYGKIDPEDQTDSFFSIAENRRRLEKLLLNSSVSAAIQYRIIHETPLIYVEIYRNYINVILLNEKGRYRDKKLEIGKENTRKWEI